MDDIQIGKVVPVNGTSRRYYDEIATGVVKVSRVG